MQAKNNNNEILNFVNMFIANLEKRLMESNVDVSIITDIENKSDHIVASLSNPTFFKQSTAMINKLWVISKTLNLTKKLSDYESHCFILRIKILVYKVVIASIANKDNLQSLDINDICNLLEIILETEYSLIKFCQLSLETIKKSSNRQEDNKDLVNNIYTTFVKSIESNHYEIIINKINETSQAFAIINQESKIYDLFIDMIRTYISKIYILFYNYNTKANSNPIERDEENDSIFKLFSFSKEKVETNRNKLISQMMIKLKSLVIICKNIEFKKDKTSTDVLIFLTQLINCSIDNNYIVFTPSFEDVISINITENLDAFKDSTLLQIIDLLLEFTSNGKISIAEENIFNILTNLNEYFISNRLFELSLKYTNDMLSLFKPSSNTELLSFCMCFDTIIKMKTDDCSHISPNEESIIVNILTHKKLTLKNISTIVNNIVTLENLDLSKTFICKILNTLGQLLKGDFKFNSISFASVDIEQYPKLIFHLSFFFFLLIENNQLDKKQIGNLIELLKSLAINLIGIYVNVAVDDDIIIIIPSLLRNFIIFFNENQNKDEFSLCLLEELLKSKDLFSSDFILLFFETILSNKSYLKLKEAVVKIESYAKKYKYDLKSESNYGFYAILSILYEGLEWDTTKRLTEYLGIMTTKSPLDYFNRIFYFYFTEIARQDVYLLSTVINNYSFYIAINSQSIAFLGYISQLLLDNKQSNKANISSIKPFFISFSKLVEFYDVSSNNNLLNEKDLLTIFILSNNILYIYTKRKIESTHESNINDSVPSFIIDFSARLMHFFCFNIHIMLRSNETNIFTNNIQLENASFISSFKMLYTSYLTNYHYSQQLKEDSNKDSTSSLDLLIKYNCTFSSLKRNLLNSKYNQNINQIFDNISNSTKTVDMLINLEFTCDKIMNQNTSSNNDLNEILLSIIFNYSSQKKLFPIVSGILYKYELKNYLSFFFNKLIDNITTKPELIKIYSIEEILLIFKDYTNVQVKVKERIKILGELSTFLFKLHKKLEDRILEDNLEYITLTIVDIKKNISQEDNNDLNLLALKQIINEISIIPLSNKSFVVSSLLEYLKEELINT